jgi:predicted NBD/HSP70 family sugar kinase
MYIFLDIGGSYTKIASSNNLKDLDNFYSFKTPLNYVQGKRKIEEEVFKISKNRKIKAIVVAIAGMVDEDKKIIIDCPNLKDWSKKSLVKDLEKKFNCSAYLKNDADLAALGEVNYTKSKNIAYLSLGTGVGGCRIIHKKIDINNFGFEPGHQIIEKNKTFENLVGGKNLKKNQIDLNNKKNLYTWHKNLSIGVINTSLLWSPDLIILGGGLSYKYLSLNYLKKLVDNNFPFNYKLKIKKAKLKNKSALFGGINYLKNK